jgi:hypothetical protein
MPFTPASVIPASFGPRPRRLAVECASRAAGERDSSRTLRDCRQARRRGNGRNVPRARYKTRSRRPVMSPVSGDLGTPVAIGEWGLQPHARNRVEKTPAKTRMEPTPLVRSRVPAGGSFNVRRERARDVIHKETCSRDNICCWLQPTGHTVPITAAPDRVESFQKPRPGR